MNVNLGIFPPLEKKIRNKALRCEEVAPAGKGFFRSLSRPPGGARGNCRIDFPSVFSLIFLSQRMGEKRNRNEKIQSGTGFSPLMKKH
jgi:NAD(FAD)-utilizing enzyme possibly involved in translation